MEPTINTHDMGFALQDSLGFVLRRVAPEKQKLSLLSNHYGKINLTVTSLKTYQVLWPGTLISFVHASEKKMSWQMQAHRNTGVLLVDKVEILYVPSESTGHNLFWIHKFLEICYYFFPLESECGEVFHLFSDSLKLASDLVGKKYDQMLHRLCLVQLLVYAGFYPEKEFSSLLLFFNNLRGELIDEVSISRLKLVDISLDKDIEKLFLIIDSWIVRSIQTHPNFRFFKAMNFLEQT